MIGRPAPGRLHRGWEFAPRLLSDSGERWSPGRARSMTPTQPWPTEGVTVTDGDRPQPGVLVVDDEEHITELVAMGLGFNGFEVERAGSGRAALAAIESRRPDLVVLDVMLPDLDGFEVARRLRQAEGAGSRVPIIFLTARDTTQDKVEVLRLGSDDYVTKPFSIEELIERVKAVLPRSTGTTARGVWL